MLNIECSLPGEMIRFELNVFVKKINVEGIEIIKVSIDFPRFGDILSISIFLSGTSVAVGLDLSWCANGGFSSGFVLCYSDVLFKYDIVYTYITL